MSDRLRSRGCAHARVRVMGEGKNYCLHPSLCVCMCGHVLTFARFVCICPRA